jgi:four helix bundle protein
MNDNEKGYRRLRVWQQAHEFVLLIYKVTKRFPREEIFGLTSQVRRATVSVAANIVEGQSRRSKNEFIQFLRVANGSLVEVEYYIGLSKDLEYITDNEATILYEKQQFIGVLLHKFIATLMR